MVLDYMPDKPPSSLEEATEFEERFKGSFKEYTKYSLSLINTLRNASGKQELKYEDLLSLTNDSKEEIT